MRALVHDPEAPQRLRFTDVPAPRPAPSQALIDVHATSLNFGELAYMADRLPVGAVPGWDAAGIVVTAAADGSGPPVGTRVAGFAPGGAWAQQRVIDTANLAAVPDGVDLADAAALPAAGVSALQAVRRLGPLAGRRVLITGASGGLGRIAVQLAARDGAHVIAAVGGIERGAGLAELGAAEVVVGLDGVAPVAAALDNVGGDLLAQVAGLLEPGAVVQAVGKASGQPTTIDFEELRNANGNAVIAAFAVQAPFGPDLAVLLDAVAAGRLDAQVDWDGPWTDAGAAVEALLDRRVRGKAVLRVVATEDAPR
jgi:NADPH2:quinone reductase